MLKCESFDPRRAVAGEGFFILIALAGNVVALLVFEHVTD